LFWIVGILCAVVAIGSFLCLEETYVPVLLKRRQKDLGRIQGCSYYFEGGSKEPLGTRLVKLVQRPLRILFTQPIVISMATYQALVFATTYVGDMVFYGFSFC
jgi:hypothetical protein